MSTESPSIVSRVPTPDIPWQVTGNHWLTLPCIHPADGSLHALGILHRGARAAVEFAGDADFMSGSAAPLLRPVLRIDGRVIDLGAQGLAWERTHSWLPTFTCTIGTIVLRATIFAPFGRDADVAGAVYALGLENRGATPVAATLSLEGRLGHRQIRVRTARATDDAHRVMTTAPDRVVLEGAAQPGLAALAITSDDAIRLETTDADAPSFAMHRDVSVPQSGRASAAFYIAAGPERDGAEATVTVMRRRGWEELLTLTRDALAGLEQTVGHESVDRLINRNLVFAYFTSLGRALDDAHFYLVRTRVPWNGHGVTVRDWEALSWTLPAVQLADSALARELLLRACELHGYAPGNGVHYLDGTLFEPGFSLEGLASFALATDRYIRETGDDQIVEEPVLADTLYLSADDLADRRDEHVPLYSTEVSLSGAPARFPYTLHGNAVVAQALDVLRRTLDEESAREVQDPEAVRAALRRHFSLEREGTITFASAIDLIGGQDTDAEQLASAYWLPLYETVERHDSAYRRTVRGVGAEPKWLATQCARLLGPEGSEVLQWLRRAPLDNGFAAEEVAPDGKAVSNGGDASLSGLLAWTVWYAVHALGLRP
ncbi:MAG TPA: hypothetical protein VJ672_12690 [Gemmatimonadaceae bacterium]|nr:hypothetical protein [Gemmatimonadaceae bacterium]